MKSTKQDVFDFFLDTCKEGNVTNFIRFIAAGIDVNEIIENDITMISKGLYYAIKNNHQNIIDYFLSLDINSYKINPIVFIEASKNGNYELIEILIAEYWNTSFMTEKNTSPYINTKTNTLDSALCLAMEYKHGKIVDKLAEMLDLEQNNYSASFISACKNGYIEVAKIIIDSGVDLTQVENKEEIKDISIIDSALYWAIEKQYTEIIDFILGTKHFEKQNFYASFIAACKNGYIEVAKQILEEGIDLSKTHKEYELSETSVIDSALYWTIENNHKDILNYLISMPFDASKCDNTFIRAYVDGLNKVIFSLLLNGFKRNEGLNKYNFLTYNLIEQGIEKKDYFIISIDGINSKEEKELKYFLLNYIEMKERILLVSKKEIKNHIKRLGNKSIEKFDINKDFIKVETFLNYIHSIKAL